MKRKSLQGFININKPKGLTSFSVIKKLRRFLPDVKLGFVGTLDPIATGVLPVCIGFATRLENEVVTTSKDYVITGLFGQSTDSFDSTGKIIDENPYDHIKEEMLEDIFPSFRGSKPQKAPIFSALKQDGARMYDLARAGRHIEPKIRTVELFKIDLTFFDLPRFTLRITCGKGFYARSLVHDIGLAFNSSAHMTDLERIRSGIFGIDSSICLEEAEKILERGDVETILYPTQAVLPESIKIILKPKELQDILNGTEVELLGNVINEGEKLAFLDSNNLLVGVGIFSNGLAVPNKVISNE